MNGLDLILLLLIAGGVYRGYQKGLILQTVSLAGAILALVVAYRFAGDVSEVLKAHVPLPEEVGGGGWIGLLPIEGIIYKAMAFLLLFVGTKFLISVGARLLNRLADIPVLSQVNRFGGAVLSLIQVFLVLLIAINLFNALSWDPGREAVRESLVSQGFLKLTPGLTEQLREWLHEGTG